MIARDLPVMPANVGVQLDARLQRPARQRRARPAGRRTCACSRVRATRASTWTSGATFDLLQLRSLVTGLGAPIDSLAGYNVHSIAIEVPIAALTRTGSRPASARRPERHDRRVVDGQPHEHHDADRRRADAHGRLGAGVAAGQSARQRSRACPLALKDAFNGLEPTGDAAALSFVTNPLLPPLMQALFGVQTPATPRNDLVTIFLTGIPG